MSLNYLFTDPNNYIQKMDVNTFNTLSSGTSTISVIGDGQTINVNTVGGTSTVSQINPVISINGNFNMQFNGGVSTFNIPFNIKYSYGVAYLMLDFTLLNIVPCDFTTFEIYSLNNPLVSQLAPIVTQNCGTTTVKDSSGLANIFQITVSTFGQLLISGLQNGFTLGQNYDFAGTAPYSLIIYMLA